MRRTCCTHDHLSSLTHHRSQQNKHKSMGSWRCSRGAPSDTKKDWRLVHAEKHILVWRSTISCHTVHVDIPAHFFGLTLVQTSLQKHLISSDEDSLNVSVGHIRQSRDSMSSEDAKLNEYRGLLWMFRTSSEEFRVCHCKLDRAPREPSRNKKKKRGLAPQKLRDHWHATDKELQQMPYTAEQRNAL